MYRGMHGVWGEVQCIGYGAIILPKSSMWYREGMHMHTRQAVHGYMYTGCRGERANRVGRAQAQPFSMQKLPVLKLNFQSFVKKKIRNWVYMSHVSTLYNIGWSYSRC